MFGPGMMGLIGPGMMPMMFVMMDANGDGAVSFEEMEAVHKRMFDLVDKNKDGKVTLDEMRDMMGGPPEKE
jgi:Ca2+-binding EF-hand superfamily protein